MGILTWILFGLVVGIIAKLLMPGRDPGGFIITILLGIAGALLGGFIGQATGFYGQNEGAGWIVDPRRHTAPGDLPDDGAPQSLTRHTTNHHEVGAKARGTRAFAWRDRISQPPAGDS